MQAHWESCVLLCRAVMCRTVNHSQQDFPPLPRGAAPPAERWGTMTMIMSAHEPWQRAACRGSLC